MVPNRATYHIFFTRLLEAFRILRRIRFKACENLYSARFTRSTYSFPDCYKVALLHGKLDPTYLYATLQCNGKCYEVLLDAVKAFCEVLQWLAFFFFWRKSFLKLVLGSKGLSEASGMFWTVFIWDIFYKYICMIYCMIYFNEPCLAFYETWFSGY